MFKCDDINFVFVIGFGLIVIGQVCEFDYLGIQVCCVLCEEGVWVILVNFNLVIIMMDFDFVDVIYIELIIWQVIEMIIVKECFDVILLMFGGQIVLNVVIQLYNYGIFEKYDVEFIGVNFEVINKGEDCQIFKQLVFDVGVDVVDFCIVYMMDEVFVVVDEFGYLLVVWLSFMMGGFGFGFVYDEEDLCWIVGVGLCDLLIIEVFLEELIFGWKEYEFEFMCDMVDNMVVVCFIENVDLVGVYMGDLIMVVLVFIFIDCEYQKM